MTPEGTVKKKVRKVLDKLGCYYFFPATGGYGKAGVPDIIVCLNGRFIGIECKAGGNKPTALQDLNLKQIEMNGGLALLINEDNVGELEELLTNEIQSK